MRSKLFWDKAGYRARKAFKGRSTTPYLIAGAGIGGLMSAYFLMKQGVRSSDIVIIERDTVGSGSTGHSAGMLVADPETEDNLNWGAFADRYGVGNAKAYRKQLLLAQQLLRRLIRINNISCGSCVEDLLILNRSIPNRLVLENEARKLRAFGERTRMLGGSRLIREIAIAGFTIAERTAPGLSVNPLELARGLAEFLERKGVKVYEKSPLLGAERGEAQLPAGSITYQTLILATGAGMPDPKLGRFLTTIAVTERLSPSKLRKLNLSDKDMFLDEADRYSFHYAKMTDDNRLLLGYGDVRVESNQKVELHLPHLREIKRFISRAFPAVPLKLEYAWSAVYALSKNNLPVVRVSSKKVVINGAGTQLGTIIAADYAITKLFGGKHVLDPLFQKRR